MEASVLHDVIFADSQAKAFADAGNDEAAALRASAVAPKETFSLRATELTIYDGFSNPVDAETVLQKLAAVASGNPIVQRAMRWLDPARGGVDIGNEKTRGMLDTLHGAGVLTEVEVSTLKSIAERSPVITANEVSAAWSRYRPDGRLS